MRRLTLGLMIILSIVSFMDFYNASAASEYCDPATQLCINATFQAYWTQNGALPVFGYAIKPASMLNNGTGTFFTQWVERNRLEHHTENIGTPYEILLGHLGKERLQMMGRNYRAEGRENGPIAGCLWFEETGHNVCNIEGSMGFMQYWRSHGLRVPGLDDYNRSLQLFGLPLTAPKMETNSSGDTVLTQWFERARFEWHPANPVEFKVLLGRLGAEVDRQPVVNPTITPTTVIPSVTPTTAAPTVTPTVVAPTITPTPQPAGANVVAIIVLDDFEEDTNIVQATNKENCMIMPDEQGVYRTGGAGGNGIHGPLVFATIEQALLGSNAVATTKLLHVSNELKSTQTPWVTRTGEWTTQEGTFYVVAVDTDNFSTGQMAPRLDALIKVLDKYQLSKIVINMSFAIVPCDPAAFQPSVETYQQLLKSGSAQDLQELRDFEAALKALNPTGNTAPAEVLFSAKSKTLRPFGRFWTILAREVYNPMLYEIIPSMGPGYPIIFPLNRLHGEIPGSALKEDPLYTVIKSLPKRQHIISVAAAGNAGHRFPFAPALWRTVVSATALTEGGSSLKWNDGDVALSGQYPLDISTKGTSFASPRLSLNSAVHLLRGGTSTCKGGRGITTSPPLEYGPAEDSTYVSDYGWANLALSQAAEHYCTGFPGIYQ